MKRSIQSQKAERHSHRKLALCVLLLATMTFAVYYRTLSNPFAEMDDSAYTTENQQTRTGLTADTVLWAFTTFETHHWQPLTWISHALDCQLFGVNPVGHHLSSILLHILNAILLFLFLARATGATWRSFMVASLFAIHPINVEAVAWVAARQHLLGAFFFLLVIGSYGWYAMRPRASRYALVVGLFALGLMAKPNIVTLPFVLLLLDFWPLQRVLGCTPSDGFAVVQFPFWQLMREKLLFLIPCAASCSVTVFAQAIIPFDVLPLRPRLLNAIYSYAAYIGKAFWPLHLAFFYTFEGYRITGSLLTICVLFLAGISFVVWRLRSRLYLPVGWLWFLVIMVPMASAQLWPRAIALADRYAYLPLIGIFVITVWTVADMADRLRFNAGWLAVLVLAALSAQSWRQIAVWKSAIDLWSHAAQVTKDNYFAEAALGTLLVVDASTRKDQMFSEEATVHFRNALHMSAADAAVIHLAENPLGENPHWTFEGVVHLALAENLHWTFETTGQHEQLSEAISHYETALVQGVGDETPWTKFALGTSYQALGKCDKAKENYQEFLGLRRSNIVPKTQKLVALTEGSLSTLKDLEKAGKCQN